ncbi:MAG TPA: hypothetical protein VJM09_15735 [Sphingobium sp.]|nr:hypothetical protein [Sphingobium sp.]
MQASGIALTHIGELLPVHALYDGAITRAGCRAAHRRIMWIVSKRGHRQERRA